ncbi:MAG: cytochrome c maturation protein CcmE [Rhodobacteraceae bacterium]|nr:cytochrome c maturation protein CcmE [Paracoccaceae bacterium]
MQGLRKRRRIQLVLLAAALLTVSVALIGYGFRDGIAYFRLPSDVIDDAPAPEEIFRLGGLVAVGSIRSTPEAIRFAVTDGDHSIEVIFKGILPDLFAEQQGVIANGSYNGVEFVAIEVLAKHDETYMPKEVADALKERGLFQPGGN